MATSFTVSSPTGWVTGTLPGEARLELYDEETLLGERPTQIFVTIAELVRDSGDPVATPIDLLVGARTIFSGQIEGGDIRINSDLFNMAVLLQERGEAEPSDALILGDRLRNQLVRITHDPRAIVLLALGGLAESVYSRLNSSKGWLPGKGPLTIFAGEDARMRKGGIRQAIVVIGSPPSIKWSIGHRDDPVQVRITLPNGKVVQAANQPFKAKTGLNGLHGIALLIGQPTDKASKTLVTDVGRYTVCPSCEIELKPRGGLLGNVTKFRVTGVDGRLQVGLKEYDLKTRGEVFLGAGEMGIEEIQAGTIRLKGRTAPVTLDGVVLSSTLWSTIPNEVKAVLIAAVLSLAGGFLLKLRVWPFVGIIFLVAFRIIG